MKELQKLSVIFFFILLFLFSFWLMFHTFSYDGKSHAMLISTKAWSDFGQHIPVIRSFSLGDNITRLTRLAMPEFALFPGTPIRYHFLFYLLVGALEKAGIRIDWALNLPSALGLFLLMVMIYLFAVELFRHKGVAILSVVFFLLNGSLSYLRFFHEHPLSTKTLNEIVTNGVFPSFAPWGPGDISAFWNLNIYTNQRHLGLAFGIGLAMLYLFLKLESLPLKKQLPWLFPTAIALGLFPYFHQPTLLILAVFMLVYFLVFPKLRIFLTFTGLIAAFFIAPQLSLLSHGPKLISWYPGYLIHDTLSPARFISYWWQNLGLHSVFIPIGFFLIPNHARRALLPIFFIFVIANLFKFSVEIAASHKLFNFALILGQMISAYVIVALLQQCNNITMKQLRKPLQAVVGVGLIVSLTLSGVIDFFAVANDPKGSVRDIPADEVATWIRNNTSPDAVFLNSSFFYHSASIAGRKIFLGWPYFAWSEGYTGDRTQTMKMIYESQNPAIFCPILAANHIDYVTVEDTRGDPNLPKIPVAYFAETFVPDFQLRQPYFIFSTHTLCEKVPL